MATLNIFYDSNKDIAWTSFAACPTELITEQKSSLAFVKLRNI